MLRGTWSYMCPDLLLASHLQRIAIWAVLSLAVGAVLWRAGAADPLRRQASVQCLLWGAINLAIAVGGAAGGCRPPSAGFLWLNVGLDIGYAGVAVTLILTGRRFGSRALQGAGWAVVPQGLVLAALDLVYLRAMGAA